MRGSQNDLRRPRSIFGRTWQFRHPLAANSCGSTGRQLARRRRCDANTKLPESPTGSPDRAAWRDRPLARMEAILFLTSEPLESGKLAEFANLANGTEARKLIRQLNRFYDNDNSAFRVEEVAGGFQLLTRPVFASWLRRLTPAAGGTPLSEPAMETLAVVAYRQPVLRAEVEAIRGVQSGEILRQLLDRDLVRITGHSEALGRPFLYGTTRRFLQVFGLRQISELPVKTGTGPPAKDTTGNGPLDPTIPGKQRPPEASELDEGEEEPKVTKQTPDDIAEENGEPSAILNRPAPCVASGVDGDGDEEHEEDEDDFDDDDDDEDEDDEDYEDEEFEDEEWEEVDDDDDDDEDEDDEDDEGDEDEDEWEDEDDEEWEDEEWEDDEE